MILTFIVAFSVALVCLTSAYLIHKITRKWARKRWPNVIKMGLFGPGCGAACLAIYLAAYGVWGGVQKQQAKVSDQVDYVREVVDFGDYQSVVHLVRIKLTPSSPVVFRLSPPSLSAAGEAGHYAMDVHEALERWGGHVAINASFFKPFKDNHLFDYYPHTGDWVIPIGPTYVGGVQYGSAASRWPLFVLGDDNGVHIYKNIRDFRQRVKDLNSIKAYFAAKSFLVREGVNVATSPSYVYPRASLALNRDKTILWMVVADGKQPGYSDGIELEKLAELLIQRGAYTAIELDGGGSASMAWRNADHVELLSRPAHTKIPNRARPIANHLILKIND